MIISSRRLTKKFDDLTAVDQASFDIKKGEVVGFVGANGAGKSTTINTLLGFISATEGEVALFDEVVHPATAHCSHARIGFAAGDMELPMNLTARQYLRYLSHQHGLDISKRLEELSKVFLPVMDKRIGTLSRGNKQKIALIAAFVTEPDLVILDEPTSGLDPIMQEKFLELVRQESARGTTIFMSSHYLAEVADVCSRIILMRDGKIISDTPAKDLLAASGKKVRIITGYGRTAAPKNAKNVEKSKTSEGQYVLEFRWHDKPADLQRWLAAVKQLIDIEVTEFDIETAFAGMYESEDES